MIFSVLPNLLNLSSRQAPFVPHSKTPDDSAEVLLRAVLFLLPAYAVYFSQGPHGLSRRCLDFVGVAQLSVLVEAYQFMIDGYDEMKRDVVLKFCPARTVYDVRAVSELVLK